MRQKVSIIRVFVLSVLAFTLIFLLNGCFREQPSEKPPIHLNPDMDYQPKFQPQEKNMFFENGMAMRESVEGTVAREELRDNSAFFAGIDSNGDTIAQMPIEVTSQTLERGRERFNIYCSPCHGTAADGKGLMVTEYKYAPPPNFYTEKVRQFHDGYFFNVITNGIRNMPSYRHQIPVADRWAIISYVRELQKNHEVVAEDTTHNMSKK